MRPLLISAALTVVATLSAQTETPSLQNLVSNSPFGTAAQAQNVATANGTPLEFRGTFVDSGERFFSIVDTATRRAEWVSLNETGRPYVVRNYDPDSETIALDHQGRTLNLKLHAARVGVLPAQPQPVANAPQPGNANAGAQAAQPSASEAQRLAQVAEEIRRRRALRQQSANPVNAQPQGQPNSQPQRQP